MKGRWLFVLALACGCGGAPTGGPAIAASAADDGCGPREARLGADCWSAVGTRWAVFADGPGGQYEFDLELFAAGRVRATDQASASPATDEWFQDGPLLRVFLADRFVEYRARVTNGTVLVGQAMNVRGQRWAFRATRVFGESTCDAREARIDGTCMTVAGTRWQLEAGTEPVLVEFLADGALAAGPEPSAEDRWQQEGASLRFSLGGRRFAAELREEATLRGTIDGGGSFTATRVESIPPLLRP